MKNQPLGWFEKTFKFLRTRLSITVQFGDTSSNVPIRKALKKAAPEEIQQLREDIDTVITPHLEAISTDTKGIFEKFIEKHSDV